MKKYLICLLLSPLFAVAQEQPPASLLLGLSVNNTVTGAAPSDQYSNNPSSTYIFPEVHVVGDIRLAENTALMLRLEAGLTFLQVKYTLEGTNGYTDYRTAYKMNEMVFTINPQLLYRFTGDKHAKFYVAAGPSVSAVSAGNNNTQMSSIQGAAYYLSGTEYDSTSWSSFAGNLKAGCFIGDRFDVFIDFVKPFAVGKPSTFFDSSLYNPSETTKQSIFKIGVNYRLF